MVNSIRKWEGSASWNNAYFTNLSDDVERFYTTCLIRIEGLDNKQTIRLMVKSVIGENEDVLLKKDIEIGIKTDALGPIFINKKCKLVIDGYLEWNYFGGAKCKIEAYITYDETFIETLRIGVFFDGTGNNAYNLRDERRENGNNAYNLREERRENGNYAYKSRKENEGESILIKQKGTNIVTNIIPKSYLLLEDSSNVRDVSNIWRLYRSFGEGRINERVYQIKTYVEGIGTKKGKKDCEITMGTGWSPVFADQTGVIAKTDDAIEQITEIIKALDGGFENIEFSIFGFSRGAAAARHFANRINKRDSRVLEIFKSKENLKIKIKFIGIFDTVASILAMSQLDFDVGGAKTGDVDITLANNISDHVFHITAGHELRENFSLNRITENYQTELELPGSHSDIGGSYKDNAEEFLNISQFLYDELENEADYKETSSYKATQEKFNDLLKHPMWGAIYKASNVEISAKKVERGTAVPVFLYSYVVQIKRYPVRTGLDRVSFQAMRYYASKCGLVFDTLPNDIAEDIPSDLEDLRKQACLRVDCIYSEKKSASLASNISPKLGAKYVHHSFFFDAEPSSYIVAHESTLDVFLNKLHLVNRCNKDLSRREFNADGTDYHRNW